MSAEASAPAPGPSRTSPEVFSLGRSLGGPRGLLESVLPYTVFSLVYGFDRQLRPAIYAALVPVVVLAVWRIVRRESLTQAVSGVLGVAIGAFAADRTGNAANFFLPNILKNAGFGLAYAVSNLVRWPLLGVVIGPLLVAGNLGADAGPAAGSSADGQTPHEQIPDEQTPEEQTPEEQTAGQLLRDMFEWRQEPATRAAYRSATWIWVGMFGVRLAVQIPLYLADRVTLLGLLNGLVLGVPLFALTLWLTWLVVRDVVRPAE